MTTGSSIPVVTLRFIVFLVALQGPFPNVFWGKEWLEVNFPCGRSQDVPSTHKTRSLKALISSEKMHFEGKGKLTSRENCTFERRFSSDRLWDNLPFFRLRESLASKQFRVGRLTGASDACSTNLGLSKIPVFSCPGSALQVASNCQESVSPHCEVRFEWSLGKWTRRSRSQ